MTRFWRYLPLVLVILGAGTFRVWSDYALTQGSGTTVIAFDATHSGTARCAAAQAQCAGVTLQSSAGVEEGNATTPLQVSLANTGANATAVTVSQATAANLNVTATITGTPPLSSGAATSALQTTGNTSLATIATAVQAPVPLPAATGGWTYKILNGTTNTGVNVKASAGTLSMVHCYNPNASVAYIQFYNNAGTPTVGTAVQLAFGVPATNSTGFALPVNGIQFTTGIAVAATTTATGSTAPGTALDCNVAYN